MTIALQYYSLCAIVMRILNLKQQHADFGRARVTLNIHQKIILATVFVTFTSLLYEELFHLSFELFHAVFESIEHVLDIGIEHWFETDTHETQIIVFYILFSVISYTLYRFYRFLPLWYDNLKRSLHQQKQQTYAQWQALPLIQQLEWWLFFVTLIACFLLFGF